MGIYEPVPNKCMQEVQLYMLLLGCKPPGRNTEQHDIFFSIADSLKSLAPQINAFWPEPEKIHIDAWRKVTMADGYSIQVIPHNEPAAAGSTTYKLFFINLGGYKENEFEEFHYRMLVVAADKKEAIQEAKASAFFQHTRFPGADSHIDDKYGVDVDDLYEIEEILPASVKEKYSIRITVSDNTARDEWHLGYTKLSSLTV